MATTTEVLLVSADFVRQLLTVSDNLAGKYLRPAIMEAQEIGLRTVLGDLLLDKLKSLVGSGSFNMDFSDDFQVDGEGAPLYFRILKEGGAQYYLAYLACVEVVRKVSFKIANAGVVRNSDEKLIVPTVDEVNALADYYQGKADFYCYRLQQWLIRHISDYPELTRADFLRIRACLYSAASCGVFLGGARGNMPYEGYDWRDAPGRREEDHR